MWTKFQIESMIITIGKKGTNKQFNWIVPAVYEASSQGGYDHKQMVICSKDR